MPREKGLQRHVVEFLNKQPLTIAHVYHGSRFSVKGYPDIHGTTRGRSIFFETKTPDGKVSEAQRVLHNNLRFAGALVFVCNSPDEFHYQWNWVDKNLGKPISAS